MMVREMNKGKTMPIIRFDGFNSSWERKRISSLMVFSNGINAPKENYGKGRKMISVMDILSNESMSYNNIRSSVEVDTKTENNNKVEVGDIVFVRSSEVRDEVGWAKAYLDKEYALFSGFTIRGKKVSEFDALFLELSINGRNRYQIERKAGGSTRYNVSQSILKDLNITQPTLIEQKKISDLFKKIADIILLQKQLLNNHKQLKKAMLQKMFPQKGESVPRIRFAGFTDNWEERMLMDVIEKQIKGKAQLNKLDVGEIQYLDTSRLNGGPVFLSDGEKNVSKEDIIILWDGSKAGTIYKGFEGTLGSTLKAYSIGKENNSELIYQYLLKNQQVIYTNYRTPNIPHVVKDFAEVFSIMTPTLEEQEKIGNFFKKLDENIVLYEQKLETYQKLKKAMLQKMFV